MALKFTVEVEDRRGAFKAAMAKAPKLARSFLHGPVLVTTSQVAQRMEQTVPVESGDLKRAIEFRTRGLQGRAGLFSDPGGDPSGEAHVALYNEYEPNRQPFMRPALQSQERQFVARATEALVNVEKALTWGRFG